MHVMADLDAVADTAIREFGAKQDPRELAQFLSWLRELREPPRYVVEVGGRGKGDILLCCLLSRICG
jgi:hypothetical protein